MVVPKLLIQLSVWVNNHTGGPKGWSLCARFYYGKLRGKKLSAALVCVADKIFWFDKDHCRRAYRLRSRRNTRD